MRPPCIHLATLLLISHIRHLFLFLRPNFPFSISPEGEWDSLGTLLGRSWDDCQNNPPKPLIINLTSPDFWQRPLKKGNFFRNFSSKIFGHVKNLLYLCRQILKNENNLSFGNEVNWTHFITEESQEQHKWFVESNLTLIFGYLNNQNVRVRDANSHNVLFFSKMQLLASRTRTFYISVLFFDHATINNP